MLRRSGGPAVRGMRFANGVPRPCRAASAQRGRRGPETRSVSLNDVTNMQVVRTHL